MQLFCVLIAMEPPARIWIPTRFLRDEKHQGESASRWTTCYRITLPVDSNQAEPCNEAEQRGTYAVVIRASAPKLCRAENHTHQQLAEGWRTPFYQRPGNAWPRRSSRVNSRVQRKRRITIFSPKMTERHRKTSCRSDCSRNEGKNYPWT